MLDFNEASSRLPPSAKDANAERESLRAELLARLESVLRDLLPTAKVRAGKLMVGDVLGSPGRSLEFALDGERQGLWIDRASQQGGDIFDFLALHRGLDTRSQFPEVMSFARELLGRAAPAYGQTQSVGGASSKSKKKPSVAVDDLGPATAKWDYHDGQGQLIACVYRYDPVDEQGVARKEFRPWDAKRRKATPPEPRPLYNQPGLATAPSDALILLVEGEKCAQALIDAGSVATTAMHGANAPVDKTDWKPMAGKAVAIWPDKDKPGWDYAIKAADAVLAAGASSCVLLVPPDDKPSGWDAADALAEQAQGIFDVTTFIAQGQRYVMQAGVSHAHSGSAQNASASSSPTDDAPEQSVWATEDALALSFTTKFAEDWRYVAAWGRWLVWTGQRWQHEETLKAQHLIRHVCRDAALAMDNHKSAVKLASSGIVGGVERLARTDRRHAATADEWDADPWLLNTPGGVVNLRNGLARPHARTDRMTKLTVAAPGNTVGDGACPTWHKFLHACTDGDAALQAYLARMVGYCLTGSTQEHALFFVYGTGGNGKSVFMNTVAGLMGDYATHAPMDSFMETRSDRHPTDMAGLRGARLVCSIETEQGRRWAESKLKALTGGDTISARFMRQDFFEFVPQFKLVVAGNHKPAIRNIDEAMKRRLHLVPFTVTIPPNQRDQHLPTKLKAERAGILAWAIQGCLAWQREGLKPPQSVLDATDEYFESEDAIGRWLADHCVLHKDAKGLTFELFADFRQWAEKSGEFVGTQRRFADALVARQFEKWRNAFGGRGFKGLGLKEPTPIPKSSLPYADN
jgi:putative DNA primase/helicase